MNFHVHKYRFECRHNGGHNHVISGYSGGMLGVYGFHFHVYYGVSSYRNHTHYFFGMTGMPVKTRNGHVHKMEGSLESDGLHEHAYEGYTFEDVSYVQGPQTAAFLTR